MTSSRDIEAARGGAAGTSPGRLMALIICGGIAAVTGWFSPGSVSIVVTEGPIALFILAAAAGLGLWLVRLLGLHDAEARWHWLLGAGLGLGGLSLLALGLGTAGVLDRSVWIGLLAGCALLGVVRWRAIRASRGSAIPHPTDSAGALRWLWLVVIGFAGLSMLAATVPPGVLWPAEGNGYDVLEYHFGAPREYLELGRIAHLPHNIYSNFPLGIEMLYLLAFVLRGDAVEGVFAAQLLNFWLAVLAVGAAWLAGREISPGGGVIAGLTVATCPFVTYLSGIAYVENGLLLYATLALAATIRATRGETTHPVAWHVAAGTAAGLACGCKYTAILMVVLPLALATAWSAIRVRPRRWAGPAVFAVAAAAAFSPWCVRNVRATGNPVFPLARGVFAERPGVWDDDGAARWHEGHLPAPADRSVGGRVSRAWHEVVWSGMYGPAVALACGVLVFAIMRRTRALRLRSASAPGSPWKRESPHDGLTVRAAPRADGRGRGDEAAIVCAITLVCGLVVWAAATHLVGRFAIVLLAPCAVALAVAWAALPGGIGRAIGVIAMIALAGGNLHRTVGFCREALLFDVAASPRVVLAFMLDGQWPGQAHVPRINGITSRGDKVLLVAEARRFYLDRGADYCVVFNRNPFAEAAAELSPPALIGWLQDRGYRYLYVGWSEMRRLRGSRYGFWRSVDEALFRDLAAAGLEVVEHFRLASARAPYGTLYQVPLRRSPADTPRT